MPTPTYTPLANITLGSSAATITFGSIPATYRDLVVVFSGLATNRGNIRINGDTGANYNWQRMSGNGSSTNAASSINQTQGLLSEFANPASTSVPLLFNINIMDYSQTNKHKTIISRADYAPSGTDAVVNRWANTAAVTSIQIFLVSGSWQAGTTAALYGIVA
jgi:hypothetical protein